MRWRSDPRIVLAASPRGWLQQLHRHVADHGGATVRATVLHGDEALAEAHEVFIGDDCTSFMTHRLVQNLHERGRRVLGVYDPADPAGKGELIDIGVDAVIARDAPPDAFVDAIAELAADATTAAEPALPTPEAAPTRSARARLIVVGGPPGGTGATEVAVALTRSLGRRSLRAALVDADADSPAVAQRLGLPAWPNLRSAVDAVEHGAGDLSRSLVGMEGGRCAVLPGLATAEAWSEVRASEVQAVITRLGQRADVVVTDIGRTLDDLPTASGVARWGIARALLSGADAVVAVGAPHPVGALRLIRWIDDARGLVGSGQMIPVVNRVPRRRFDSEELSQEVRAGTGATPWLLPEDRQVVRSAWSGEAVRSGPFARAADRLARHILDSQRQDD